MSEQFKLTGLALEGLEEQIERRAGPGPDEPPAPTTVGEAAELPEDDRAAAADSPASPFSALLQSLAEDWDVARGFPPQSHRTLGGAVVAAKKGFRLALQPIIDEAFARQKAFNRRLLDLLTALHAENQALAERVARLEQPRDRS